MSAPAAQRPSSPAREAPAPSALLPAAFPPEVVEILFAPFAADEIEWRPQGSAFQRDGAWVVQASLYVKRAPLLDRFDAAFGPGNWQFSWEPLAVVDGVVTKVKGVLTTAYTDRPYADIGVASHIEPDKGAVTDAEKRVGSLVGAGRYLARAPRLLVPVTRDQDDGAGKKKSGASISREGHALLRRFVGAWDGTVAHGERLWRELSARAGGAGGATREARGARDARAASTASSLATSADDAGGAGGAESDDLAQVKRQITDLSQRMGRQVGNLDGLTIEGARRVLDGLARRAS